VGRWVGEPWWVRSRIPDQLSNSLTKINNLGSLAVLKIPHGERSGWGIGWVDFPRGPQAIISSATALAPACPQRSPQIRPMVVTSKPANEKAIRTSHSFTLSGLFRQGRFCIRSGIGAGAGDSQGGGSPSCGGSRRMGRAGGFCWRGTCCGVGGTRPPRLSPGGGNGKEGDQLPCCRRLIPGSWYARGSFGAPTARPALENMPVMKKPVQHRTDRGGIAQQLSPVFYWSI
jgi:hypothetical protein